jgi:hypothetical protein
MAGQCAEERTDRGWATRFGHVATIVLLLVVAGCDRPDEGALCGGKVFARVSLPNNHTPHLSLAIDGARRDFLLDYGSTQSVLWTKDRPGSGAATRIALPLPGMSDARFVLRHTDFDWAGQGVIGTDLLSQVSVQLTGGAAFVGRSACDAGALRASSLIPVDQSGFFSQDPSKVKSRPNVPILYIDLAGIRAPAQIDTGYNDSVYEHSLDVNQPLFDLLQKAGTAMMRQQDIVVETCAGRETWPVYRLADSRLTFATQQAAPIASTKDFYIILKPRNACGGIATMTEPAGQIAASFLKLFDTVVFDPWAQTVWLAPRGER